MVRLELVFMFRVDKCWLFVYVEYAYFFIFLDCFALFDTYYFFDTLKWLMFEDVNVYLLTNVLFGTSFIIRRTMATKVKVEISEAFLSRERKLGEMKWATRRFTYFEFISL